MRFSLRLRILLFLLCMLLTFPSVADASVQQPALSAGTTYALFFSNVGRVALCADTLDLPTEEASVIGDALSEPENMLRLTAAESNGKWTFSVNGLFLSCGYGAGAFLTDVAGESAQWEALPQDGGVLLCCTVAGTVFLLGCFENVITVRPYDPAYISACLVRLIPTNEASSVSAYAYRPTSISDLPNDGKSYPIITTGVLTARYGNYGFVDSAVLCDHGHSIEVYQPLLADSFDQPLQIGDRVSIVAKRSNMGVMPYLDDLVRVRRIGRESVSYPTYNSLSELAANGMRLRGCAVLVKNVTLGEWQSDRMTTLTDAFGATLPLYRAAPYPEGTCAGCASDLLLVIEYQGDFLQLRMGEASYIADHSAQIAAFLALDSTLQYRTGGVLRIQIDSSIPIAWAKGTFYRPEDILSNAFVPMFEAYLFPTSTSGVYSLTVPANALPAASYTLRIAIATTANPLTPQYVDFEIVVD